jgi:hypothetical protein
MFQSSISNIRCRTAAADCTPQKLYVILSGSDSGAFCKLMDVLALFALYLELPLVQRQLRNRVGGS